MTSFIDRKYAHMEEVFAPKGKGKPTLPFSEFITDHGTHPMVYTAIPGKHSSEHHYRARYSIPLRGEIVRVSVVSGALFHCAPDAPYEVRVKVQAAALNRADLAVLAGNRHGAVGGAGTVMGMEWAGVVDAVGNQVEAFQAGERVMGSGQGALAEFAVVDQGRVMPVPVATWTPAPPKKEARPAQTSRANTRAANVREESGSG